MAKCLALIFLLLVLQACAPSMEKVNEIYGDDEHAISTVERPEILYSDEATVRVRITGEEMLIHQVEEPWIEFTKGIFIQFFDEEGNVMSTLRAGKARRYEALQETILEKDVLFISSKQEELNTQQLVWDEAKKMFSSQREVELKSGNEIVQGSGFAAKQDFSWYKITNITGTINVKDAEGS